MSTFHFVPGTISREDCETERDWDAKVYTTTAIEKRQGVSQGRNDAWQGLWLNIEHE
jgi:hypothetical protein